MTSLRETMQDFQAFILEGATHVIEQTVTTKNLTARDRLKIYKQSYYLRLMDILNNGFPILKKFMGKKAFAKVSEDYIISHPSKHFSIGFFSRYFSKFLLTQTNFSPIYGEIAQFEWMLENVLEAPDAECLILQDLTKISPEQWGYVQFTFHPSVQLMQFHYNAPEVWFMAHAGKPKPKIMQNENPSEWMVWRNQLDARYFKATPEQAWILHAIQQGKIFAELCEGLCQWFSEQEAGLYAAHIIQKWISEGVFSSITVNIV